MKKITVLIPCYNEADGIADVIHGFPKESLRRQGFVLDVLVVDNNSSDNTSVVALSAGARVIHEPKKGKGNAIRTGFQNVGDADYVVMLDGDNTYRSAEISRLIEPLESGFSDVVIGSRLHGKISDGSMKRMNHFGNRLFSRLVRIAYNVMATDVLTGYFAWKRPVVEQLHPFLTSQGFAIEMEMITKMARMGFAISSVPISYDARAGESSLRPIADGSRILAMFSKNLRWKPPVWTTPGVVGELNDSAMVTRDSLWKGVPPLAHQGYAKPFEP